MKTIYYLENIRGVEGTKRYLTLFDTSNPESQPFEVEVSIERLIRNSNGDLWSENNYVYYNPESQGESVLTSANRTKVARDAYNEYLAFQQWALSQAERRIEQRFTQEDYNDASRVMSYHVNVGHGNCTIIAIQLKTAIELWMIDCSTYDLSNHQSTIANIKSAFAQIASDFAISPKDLFLSRFVLTHKHYDHYSGMEYLINNNFIRPNTIIFSNYNYACTSQTILQIQKLIMQHNIHVVEPLTTTKGYAGMRFLHPECTIVASKQHKSYARPHRYVSKANNASVVVCIDVANKKMVLPSDLETEGFRQMTSKHGCRTDLFYCSYYCLSHHGSINGHPQMGCDPNNPLSCAMHHLRYAILMGRDGAYSGIYNKNVVVPFWGKFLKYSQFDANGNTQAFLKIVW